MAREQPRSRRCSQAWLAARARAYTDFARRSFRQRDGRDLDAASNFPVRLCLQRLCKYQEFWSPKTSDPKRSNMPMPENSDASCWTLARHTWHPGVLTCQLYGVVTLSLPMGINTLRQSCSSLDLKFANSFFNTPLDLRILLLDPQ